MSTTQQRNLQGLKALVTGATAGLGKEIAVRILECLLEKRQQDWIPGMYAWAVRSGIRVLTQPHRPASRARTIAAARSATCSLPSMFET